MAFEIFPLEVWEVLLNAFAAEEAYGTYLAFPELRTETVISEKLPKWMFYLVAHRICPGLSRKDKLNCRLVCRQWCQGIDRAVQYRPSYFPYPHRNEDGLLPLLNRNPFRFHPYHPHRILSTPSAFMTIENLQRFLVLMDGQVRNPFICRSLSFRKHVGRNFRDGQWETPTAFWEASLAILETHGEHIWYLRIHEHGRNQNPASVLQFVFQSLHFTPNLKALQLRTYWEEPFADMEHIEQSVEELSASLPILPQLRCMTFIRTLLSLTNVFLEAYGQQLEKVIIDHDLWREDSAHLLPRLTDLTLTRGSVADIARVLTTIQSPLVKLYIDLHDVAVTVDGLSLVSSIVPILRRFPCMEFFGFYLSPKGIFQGPFPEVDPSPIVSGRLTRIPSIKSLHIQWNSLAVKQGFLMCFPNLRNIQVRLLHKNVGFYEEGRFLWEVACPKLEFASVIVGSSRERGGRFYHRSFDRDGYNRRSGERAERVYNQVVGDEMCQ